MEAKTGSFEHQFEERKRQHIAQSLLPAHQAAGLSGLDSIRLCHEALPELDLAEVTLHASSLGRRLSTPFFVAGMTMGHADAASLNAELARACARRGWILGVGSQRRELEGRAIAGEGSALRKAAPDAVILANIGISQLITSGPGVDSIRALVDSVEAQALVVHLNALQEALQPEGTPRFKGGLAAIERTVRGIGVPVLVKETGCGVSESTLVRLKSAGVTAVDVSGLGGTHWGRIEGARAGEGSEQFQAALTFAEWGIPTVQSVRAGLRARIPVWASGGVRSGLDAAKLVALGAERVGFAQPALQAVADGPEALDRWMSLMEFELKVALFCTGSASVEALRSRGEAALV